MSGPDPRARARRRLALISVTAVLALGAAIPGPAAAASEPATVLLNFGVGGPWAGSAGVDAAKLPTQSYDVDHVRVYQK